jgi:hypothetical protein
MDANADKIEYPSRAPDIVRGLADGIGINDFTVQSTMDGITTLWIPAKACVTSSAI